MKETTKRVIGVLCLLIILLTCIYRVNWLLARKESNNRYASFFSDETDIDVLLLGASHIRHGIFPMELWRDYGITSYNIAGNGSTIPVSCWVLVNALDYKTPKVVVMDVFDIWPNRVCSNMWGQVQDQFDAFPLSVNKYRMVKDLFNDKELTDGEGVSIYDRRWELLFNMGAYHTRWKDLLEEDFYSKSEFEEMSGVWKGAAPLGGVVERQKHVYDPLAEYEPDKLATTYLLKIIDLCKERGIELLLLNTGFDCGDESKTFHDSVYGIASEHGITYIDLTQKEYLFNFETDLSDTGENTHVNYSGAMKFTKYLGSELRKEFSLEDHRGDLAYSKWNEDYDKYVESKHDYLKKQKDLKNYLSFLYDKDYKVIIEVQNPEVLSFDVMALLDNMGIQAKEGENLFCADLNTKESDSFSVNWKEPFSVDTLVGELGYFGNREGEFGFYRNGEEIFVKRPDEDKSWIRVITYSDYSEDIIDVHEFDGESIEKGDEE